MYMRSSAQLLEKIYNTTKSRIGIGGTQETHVFKILGFTFSVCFHEVRKPNMKIHLATNSV